MKSIEIRGGRETWPLRVPSETPILDAAPLVPVDFDADACIRDALRQLPHHPQRPLIVVPDRTRNAHLSFWLPRIWRSLQKTNASPTELHCIFASGTHKPMSKTEMLDAVGAIDVPVVLHAHDSTGNLQVAGTDSFGKPVLLAPQLFQSDGVMVLSAMKFHYLAGFGGGRKMIIPGICDFDSARRMHATSLSSAPPGRARGVRSGRLDDNPLHNWILSTLERLELPPLCGICMVNGPTGPVDAEGGALVGHHRRLAQRFATSRTVHLAQPLDGVVLSCGGHPYDVDLVQAHKAIDAIAPLLRPGAHVAWIAALPRGLGHDSMKEWLIDGNADTQLLRLLNDFHIGKQTAWSIRRHIERFHVGLLARFATSLPDTLGVQRFADLKDAWDFVRRAGPNVAIAPFGGELRYEQIATN